MDWGVHLLDRIVLMVPEKIKKVYAKMTHVTNDEVDDGFIMNMVFESGITATVEVGTCNFITLPHWYLCGDQGTAEIKDFRDPGRMVVLRSWEDKDATPILMGEGLSKTMAPRNPDSVDELPLPDFSYDRNELYSNVCDVVMGKAEQIVKNEEALRVLRLMEAALSPTKRALWWTLNKQKRQTGENPRNRGSGGFVVCRSGLHVQNSHGDVKEEY